VREVHLALGASPRPSSEDLPPQVLQLLPRRHPHSPRHRCQSRPCEEQPPPRRPYPVGGGARAQLAHDGAAACDS